MPVTLADTESDAIKRTRQATESLLAALIEHHDYRMKWPEFYQRPVKTVPPVDEPKAPWFSIVEEIGPAEPLPPRAPRLEDIQRACAKHYGVSRNDILSARRTANVMRPRQVAYYLAKTLTKKSLPEIGRRFGGRDHTTVLHGTRKIAGLIDIDPVIAADIQSLSAQLGA